jgi:hypothetical protein
LPLKTGVFEVVPETTSTLLIVELAFARVATTIFYRFKYFLRSLQRSIK